MQRAFSLLWAIVLTLTVNAPAGAVGHGQASGKTSLNSMLVLEQTTRGLGPMTTYIYRDRVKCVVGTHWIYLSAAPDWEVVVFNPKTKLMARIPFDKFVKYGPETAGYVESVIHDWPRVLDKPDCKYAGMDAVNYALPFRYKNGKLVSLRHGKVGEYVLAKSVKADQHVIRFLQAFQRTPPDPRVPLKYAKLGYPNLYGTGLKYNKQESWVVNLSTQASRMVPYDKKLFMKPQGYKPATEGEVTLGEKASEMNHVFEVMDGR